MRYVCTIFDNIAGSIHLVHLEVGSRGGIDVLKAYLREMRERSIGTYVLGFEFEFPTCMTIAIIRSTRSECGRKKELLPNLI